MLQNSREFSCLAILNPLHLNAIRAGLHIVAIFLCSNHAVVIIVKSHSPSPTIFLKRNELLYYSHFAYLYFVLVDPSLPTCLLACLHFCATAHATA